MNLTEEEINQAVTDGLLALNEATVKDYALVYPQGFVPNAYRWKAPGTRVRVNRDGSHTLEGYDRKRSYGKGSYITLWRTYQNIHSTKP